MGLAVPGVAVSASATEDEVGASGPTLEAVLLPTINGVARYGFQLSATPGEWSLPGATFSYQWLRRGEAIPGATGVTYTLTQDDVGTRLQVRVRAQVGGLVGKAKSEWTRSVAKAVPKVKVAVSKKKVARKSRPHARITVTVHGTKQPVGKLIVRVGKKKLFKKVTASKYGHIKVRLPKLRKKGIFPVTATFRPSAPTKALARPADSRPFLLKAH